ncbi:hypothetical protein [Citrobacter freundii]|uniref:Uncharacterized protein n=1 Tax=Citrobacter freundii TaxID=546 RepID=A0A7G2IJJ4_CITFR|nr:hypothetical protein [Citrobacter freundii]
MLKRSALLPQNLKSSRISPQFSAFYLDTARLGLALENDTFKVIEEVKRIAEKRNWSPLSVAVYATYKKPGIRPEIAGDVITLLAQDEALSATIRR